MVELPPLPTREVVTVSVGELEEVDAESAQPDIIMATTTAQAIWVCEASVRHLPVAAGSLVFHGAHLNVCLAFS